MSKGLSWSCPARNHQVCSARNHQVCSVELGPGELSSNGILGNRISWGLLVSRLIFQGKTVVFMGYQIFQGTPPLTGSPTALWKNYCRENTLADQSSRGMLFVLGYIFSCIFDSFLGQMRSNNLLGCSFGRPHAGAPS